MKKKSALGTSLNLTLKENKHCNFLYNKLNDERNIEEQVNSTVILPIVSFPRTTSNDIDTLIAKCKNGEVQIIPICLLEEIGLDSMVRTHEEKAKKPFKAFKV